MSKNVRYNYGMFKTLRDRERAKLIIRAILHEAGGTLDLRTSLYKAFYAAHLYYFAETPGVLSNWPVVRMPEGPGIDDGQTLIAQMVRENLIAEYDSYSPYHEYSYKLLKPLGPDEISRDERAAITKAVAYVKGKTARSLSRELHEKSYSWKNAKDGEVLNIYLDLLDEEERAAEFALAKRTAEEVSRAFT